MVANPREWRIRTARESDLDEILAIEEASFAPNVRERPETFADRISTFPEGFLLLSRADDVGGRAVGYLSSELWGEIPGPAADRWALGHAASARHSPEGRVLYVSSFAVAPGARGGVGRYFFGESIRMILDAAPLVRAITFIVCESWTAARRIYETDGFAYSGELPGFFAGGSRPESALIMVKSLRSAQGRNKAQ